MSKDLTVDQIEQNIGAMTGRANGESLQMSPEQLRDMLSIVARDTYMDVMRHGSETPYSFGSLDDFESRQYEASTVRQHYGPSAVPPELRGQLIGFRPLDEHSTSDYDLKPKIRNRAISMSREMSRLDPTISHAVKLYTDFGIGTGAFVNTEGRGKAKKAIEYIFNNPKFNRIFGKRAQQVNSERLLADGDFIVDIRGRRGSPDSIHFARIDPTTITRTLVNPANTDEVWGWERTFFMPSPKDGGPSSIPTSTGYLHVASKSPGGTLLREYVADWTGTKEPGESFDVMTTDGFKKIQLQPDRRFVSLSMNTLGHRGNPMATAAIPWALEFNRYMRARTSIQRAVAAVATKIAIKGGSTADASSVQGLFNSTVRSREDALETNPYPGAGATAIMNDKVQMETSSFETGANAAKIDTNILLTIVAIAMHLFPHWMGFGDSFRLATARAMEPPLRKLFESYQGGWVEFYSTVALVTMDLMGVRPADRNVDIHFPEVMKSDSSAILEGLNRSLMNQPWLQLIPEFNKRTFELSGMDDPDGLWKRVEAEVMPVIEEIVANHAKGGSNELAGRRPDMTEEDNLGTPTEDDPNGERQG